MQIGKVPENILKRSVFKQIHHRRPEVLLHPGVGEDCSAVEAGEGEVLVFSVDPITATEKGMGTFAVHVTANDCFFRSRTGWNYDKYHSAAQKEREIS